MALLNAAVWCGSSIFLFVGLPAVFSPEMKRLLTPAGVGFAAESILARYFILQYCCAAIALAHLMAEWFFYGKSPWRLNFALVAVVLTIALAGGIWAQPKMKALHIAKYFGRTVDQRTRAGKIFAAWHGASEAANLAAGICLVCYLWRVSKDRAPERIVSLSKMKG